MLVRDLIAQLQSVPQDKEVSIRDTENEKDIPIKDVFYLGNIVSIEFDED